MNKICCLAAFCGMIMVLASCHSTKTVVKEPSAAIVANSQNNAENVLAQLVRTDQNTKNVVTKIKTTVHRNGSEVSLSGNLKMRRNECVQIQLMAMGLVEVVRMEITPEYIMLIDRLHKKYVREQYADIEFLKANGLGFYALQALFWNELFCPGINGITEKDKDNFTVRPQNLQQLISLKDSAKPHTAVMDAATLAWIAEDNKITRTDLQYTDEKSRSSYIHWQYSDFVNMGNRYFPSDNKIQVKTPRVNIEVEMKLGNVSHDSSWECRTNLSDRYERITIEELVQRIRQL